jgi:hypothetical protein
MSEQWYAPNQQAVHVGAVGPASDEPRTTLDLDALTKAELVEEARRRGVEVNASATKAQILEALAAR